MSNIDQAFVKQYESEVHVAYQRMGSKLRNTVRIKDNVKGESTTFQKVGTGTAAQKTRNGDVPVMNLDHTPVECTLGDWYAGEYVDDLDELKINHSEREVIAQAGAAALGRKTDELIVAKLDSATTYSTTASLSQLTSSAGATYFTNMVTTMGARDVPVGDGQMFGVVSWQVWNKMLSMEEFKNADYVGADQLPFKTMATSARRWLDCIWMPHSGLTISSNVRKNFLYHKRSIGHAIGKDVTVTPSWENTKSAFFLNQRMSQGTALIDAIGVEQFLVNEAS